MDARGSTSRDVTSSSRREFGAGLPALDVEDVAVVLPASYAARCGRCGTAYLPGSTIGHSATYGWVATCCVPGMRRGARQQAQGA
ncbi:hypothetical protein EV189_1491 [Motilibacter rhizosphaerae]|uniref:Uncharacterized protein n=1 Tax=Motilibacter rhizosphaerae TaxID=598652 RepID=A0A4Q7NSG8_9ACTN|nr:hypothetical protein [Motilibacter rhizosphaerae]RZS89718.1 hypothetical protein EV189_1491 [Motilibacter rhizosphaerae]